MFYTIIYTTVCSPVCCRELAALPPPAGRLGSAGRGSPRRRLQPGSGPRRAAAGRSSCSAPQPARSPAPSPSSAPSSSPDRRPAWRGSLGERGVSERGLNLKDVQFECPICLKCYLLKKIRSHSILVNICFLNVVNLQQ